MRKLSRQGINQNRNIVAIVLFTLVMLLLAACGPAEQEDVALDDALWDDGPTPPMTIEPAEPAVDFELIDQHRQTFRLSDQQGKVVVLFFGYATCPDVCPTTLGRLAAVKNELGDKADDTRFVFVTVDPARDTPEKLGEMIKRFGDEDFIGVTGDPGAMVKLWDDYNVFVQQEPAEDAEYVEEGHYWVAHSSWVYLIDPDGVMPIMYAANFDIERMAQDITDLLEG